MSNTSASREHALPCFEVVSYGLGDMSASLAWNTVAAFALYFYIAYPLALGDYDPADVTDKARSVMSWLYYGLPIAVYVLQIICVQHLVSWLRNQVDTPDPDLCDEVSG